MSAERKEVCDLLEAAGLDPKTIPQDGIYEEGFQAVELDEGGTIQPDPRDPTRILTRFHPWTIPDAERDAILDAYGRYATAEYLRRGSIRRRTLMSVVACHVCNGAVSIAWLFEHPGSTPTRTWAARCTW